MAETQTLIDGLVSDLRPVRRDAVALRLGLGLGAGLIASALFMLFGMGLRADLDQAVAARFFWIKFAYTILFALLGALAVERLARPAGEARSPATGMAAVFAAIVLLALAQYAAAPPDARVALFFGSTANRCPFIIVALSLPMLAGTFWAVRGLAPTRLVPAGAAAGLMAGGAGAWIYSFYCGENAMPFVAIWYTLGIAAVGALGALLGRTMLRW